MIVPVRATTINIADIKPRAYLRCARWHRHWHKAVGANAMDCDRCGLRWSW